jgi:hypothetical protein
LIIAIVGSIEVILEAWRQKDKANVLGVYFSEKADNGQRIDSLVAAFEREGFSIARNIFEDYLAIKYLRNTISHSKWKEYQKEFVESHAFPTDVREFKLEDFNRMSKIYNDIAIYIAQTEFSDSNREGFANLARLFAE